MDALIIYWSKTGNTKKVALAIKQGLVDAGARVILKTTEEAEDCDWFNYELVCMGCPSYQWSPPKPVTDYLSGMFNHYRRDGRIKPGSPRVDDKKALMFCTFSGPHTGINEAIPVTKNMGQYFDHLGFNIIDEWHILGEFHGSEELSTQGRMGNIKGLPSEEDLLKIRKDSARIVKPS